MLERWREHVTCSPRRSAAAGRAASGVLRGPPTPNGQPGANTCPARVLKDIFPRYKTMRGHSS
jgi:isoleucyl-tRNA synthetase